MFFVRHELIKTLRPGPGSRGARDSSAAPVTIRIPGPSMGLGPVTYMQGKTMSRISRKAPAKARPKMSAEALAEAVAVSKATPMAEKMARAKRVVLGVAFEDPLSGPGEREAFDTAIDMLNKSMARPKSKITGEMLRGFERPARKFLTAELARLRGVGEAAPETSSGS